MKRKRKDNRGETLVEVLASILIGSLSVALLFSMVMASGSMDRSAETVDEIFSKYLSAAEGRTPVKDDAGAPIPPVPGTVAVTNTTSGSNTNLPVTFYGGEGALSYALPKETSP